MLTWKRNMRGYKIGMAVCILVALSVFTWWCVQWRSSLGYVGWGNIAFDNRQWKEAADDEVADNIRGKMVRDLLRRHHLEGMTRGEVLTLLGLPDMVDYHEKPLPSVRDVTRRTAAKAGEFDYFLGAYSGLFPGIDGDFLGLFFDSQGRVVQWRIFGT